MAFVFDPAYFMIMSQWSILRIVGGAWYMNWVNVSYGNQLKFVREWTDNVKIFTVQKVMEKKQGWSVETDD